MGWRAAVSRSVPVCPESVAAGHDQNGPASGALMATATEAETRLMHLQEQLKFLTDGLAHTVQGLWTGGESLESDLKRLNPTTPLTPRPPLLTSQAPAPPQGWRAS